VIFSAGSIQHQLATRQQIRSQQSPQHAPRAAHSKLSRSPRSEVATVAFEQGQFDIGCCSFGCSSDAPVAALSTTPAFLARPPRPSGPDHATSLKPRACCGRPPGLRPPPRSVHARASQPRQQLACYFRACAPCSALPATVAPPAHHSSAHSVRGVPATGPSQPAIGPNARATAAKGLLALPTYCSGKRALWDPPPATSKKG
jgi:hypothetical protein